MQKTKKKHFIYLIIAIAACAWCVIGTGCGGDEEAGSVQIHVAENGSDSEGSGSPENPYATITYAASQAGPGTEVIVHEGSYEKLELDSSVSGMKGAPVVFRAADGENPVIRPGKGTKGEDSVGIHIVNADHITIDGLEIEGGTHGIYYESTSEQGETPLENIAIKNCTVHGIRGTHGICVYACNDLAPVKNLTMERCRVYDCECGSSESTVLNGNVDGFLISGNVIYDNNNIGIDMIGFEGNAKHETGSGFDNLYDADFVRNGACSDNVVYNISAEGNAAYYEDGAYELCAGGIYVDGGQDIEIFHNFIFNCDIGLEIATEHSPDENPLFRVSGIRVHDNVIADCTGWCGICFGGYDRHLGYTEGCEFSNNTLIDNDTQIGIQKSKGNSVQYNLIVGGSKGVEYNSDCRKKDLISNTIENNAASEIAEQDSWNRSYGKVYQNRNEVIDGFASLLEGYGSAFVPDDAAIELYRSRRAE